MQNRKFLVSYDMMLGGSYGGPSAIVGAPTHQSFSLSSSVSSSGIVSGVLWGVLGVLVWCHTPEQSEELNKRPGLREVLPCSAAPPGTSACAFTHWHVQKWDSRLTFAVLDRWLRMQGDNARTTTSVLHMDSAALCRPVKLPGNRPCEALRSEPLCTLTFAAFFLM